MYVEQRPSALGLEHTSEALCLTRPPISGWQVNSSILSQFVQFVVDLGPDAAFLRFMQSSCTCKGTGVSAKQESIFKELFGRPRSCDPRPRPLGRGQNRGRRWSSIVQ